MQVHLLLASTQSIKIVHFSSMRLCQMKPQLSSNLQGPFPFHAPTEVNISGSTAVGCLTKPDMVIDVALTIPKACFYEKDHLDCKYHGKRALWLSVLAAQLKKNAMFKQQEWVLLNNDPRYTVCVLYKGAAFHMQQQYSIL